MLSVPDILRNESSSSVVSPELLESVRTVARAAGDEILSVYATDFEVRTKSDASPVTNADERAEALILRELARLTPGIPIVSEEAAATNAFSVQPGPRFWLVDPLDGTKEFVHRNGEFTVNISLVEDGHPTLGVVHCPALGRLYAGAGDFGAFVDDGGDRRRRIACRRPPERGLTIVSSRRHGNIKALARFTAGRPVAAALSAGSSLKFCLVAAGDADLYPRIGRTMEWDTAAGHAVVAAAGGKVSVVGGGELSYGKPGFENPPFIAQGL